MASKPSLLTVLWRYVMRQLLGGFQIPQSSSTATTKTSRPTPNTRAGNEGYSDKTHVTPTALITAFEYYYDKGELTPQTIRSYQDEADRLFIEASKANSRYSNEMYKILEFQALIFKAEGSDDDALIALQRAYTLLPANSHFISNAAQNWLNTVVSPNKEVEAQEKPVSVRHKTENDDAGLAPRGDEMVVKTRTAQFSSWDEPQLWNGWTFDHEGKHVDPESPWGKRRIKVMSRDKMQCQKCGVKNNLTVHHRVPLSLGGSNNLPNLITLCTSCHENEHKRIIYSSGRDFDDIGHYGQRYKVGKKIKLISSAVASGAKLKIKYTNLQGIKSTREIKPLGITREHRRVYVKAYCYLRKEDRIFRLSRMRIV